MQGLDLFETSLGPPLRKARFGLAQDVFRVWKWHTTTQGRGATLYMAFSEDENFSVVLCLMVSKDVDSVAGELAWALRSMRESGGSINVGDTLDLRRPLWDASPMELILIDQPAPLLSGLLSIQAPHQSQTHILQAIPIRREELKVRDILGSEEFLSRLLADDSYLSVERHAMSTD